MHRAFTEADRAMIEAVDAATRYQLDQDGIRPRSADGLAGILWAPLLHADFAHLIANVIPGAVLGFLLLMAGRFLVVTAVVWVVSGFGVWLTAPAGSVTIGASGIVFGWLAYLLVRGLFNRDVWQVLGGVVLCAFATGLYVGAQFGPGPRDGLMTGLAHRTRFSVRAIRTTIEVAVVVAGWLLGGVVGVGTVVFALWNAEEGGAEVMGSKVYVQEAKASGLDIALYLNFDSACYDPDGSMVLDIMFEESTRCVAGLMSESNQLYKIGLKLTYNVHTCGSDHRAFWAEGYPAVMTHQPEHGPAHTANDTVDQVSTLFAKRNGQLGMSAMAHLAGVHAMADE